MHIGLITAAFPPDLDGIGDYTWFMAKALVELGHRVTVFTRGGEMTELSEGCIVSFYDPARPESFSGLAGALEGLPESERPEWLVLQYNPFSWGVRGFCPALAATLNQLRRRPPAGRVAVMLHETTVPRWPWKFAVMRLWQRPILKSVCRTADQIFVSTRRWLPEIASYAPPISVSVLPVGANIPRSALDRGEAKARLGFSAETLVIGVFGGSHVSRRLDWIAAAATALSESREKTAILHVGPDGDAVKRFCNGLSVRTEGILPADAVADRLRAMDLLLSPFIDGVSTRRGSVMAALANGVPVATTRRAWSDDIFGAAPGGSVLLSEATTGERFAAEVASWTRTLPRDLGLRIEAFSDQHFGWRRISEQMNERLATFDSATRR